MKISYIKAKEYDNVFDLANSVDSIKKMSTTQKCEYVTIAERSASWIWEKLKNNKMYQSGACLGMCSMFMVNPCFAATTAATAPSAVQPIISIISQLVDSVQLVGFYLGMAMVLFEVIKSLMEGDPRRIPGVVTKYAIGIALLYAIPGILTAIRDAFKSASSVAG